MIRHRVHPGAAGRPRRNRRRRGFTLLELILAASFTAAACTAAVELLQAIDHASSLGGGIHQANAAARDALGCMDLLVEQASLIGFRDSQKILLWRSDDNDDGKINLLELSLVRYVPASGNLDLVEVRLPKGTSIGDIQQQNIALTTAQLGTVAATNLVEQHASACVRTLLNGVSQFAAWSDGTGVSSQMVQVTFTVARDDGSQVFHAVMTPRSPAWDMMP